MDYITVLLYAMLFISGAFLGSFINVVADRASKGQSFLFGRSKCETCNKVLSPRDLIPVLSYLLAKGKCRHCKEKLSLWYPISEIVTGALFAGLAYYLNLFVNVSYAYVWVFYVYFAIVGMSYIALFLADIKYMLLPTKIVVPTIAFVLLFLAGNVGFTIISSYKALQADDFGKYLIESGYWQTQILLMLRSVAYSVGSAAAIALFFWILTKIKQGQAMGKGDIKLAFLIGLVNGFPFNVLAIFLGFLMGALYSVGLLALKKKTLQSTIPFGPFLIVGSVVSIVYGAQLLNWFFSLSNLVPAAM
ncbi:prepilin peptidase [Candidatus Nomurabacteria bacterium]|nr:prepilin peptidase [Candidatus Nomurabacteria bacterium]MCB9827209.1 prepilin peptidase [Candidatus Nomurabacteria bacterium]MCB9827507.1 prepilin peptidase [Candidatus Nomurabacteria bacterium]HXK52566.1 prepilin peptidase [bacterium]